MRRELKKKVNLNCLKTGCSPCMSEAKKKQRKIANRDLSEIKIQEIKSIVSFIFKQKKVIDVFKYKSLTPSND